jgi:phosphoribosyl-ATP pyrophosphohydrolase/phosphoribosyl-AMP cyclohydrolase
MRSDELHIRFDERGLVPAVVQDAATGQVLMVAWMNEEALRLTQATGQAHFWSRSRRELWHKGATSGSFMHVRHMQVDCDADTLLLQVDPTGPACHTGNRSCFFRYIGEFVEPRVRRDVDGSNVLHTLFATILNRQTNPRPGSYTAHLLEAGEDEILKKVGEEAVEVILAAKGQGDERLVAEMADLLYHLLVLLAARGLTLADVEAELDRRRQF